MTSFKSHSVLVMDLRNQKWGNQDVPCVRNSSRLLPSLHWLSAQCHTCFLRGVMPLWGRDQGVRGRPSKACHTVLFCHLSEQSASAVFYGWNGTETTPLSLMKVDCCRAVWGWGPAPSPVPHLLVGSTGELPELIPFSVWPVGFLSDPDSLNRVGLQQE